MCNAVSVLTVGSEIAADPHPIAAMHCQVIFLQGMPPCIGAATSVQLPISAIAAICAPATATGAIAIAVDWPIRPIIAPNSRTRWRRVFTGALFACQS